MKKQTKFNKQSAIYFEIKNQLKAYWSFIEAQNHTPYNFSSRAKQ